MDQGLFSLAAACIAFVGTHFLLSHPLRARLVRSLTERGFLAVYSLIALGTLGWVITAFARAERGAPLWDGTAPLAWIGTSVITYLALVLLAASFDRNPALPQANVAGLSARKPWGVFRVTRHPMMIAIALWALSHVIVAPTQRTIILCLAIAILALLGALLQDRRKLAQNGREWSAWLARTHFVPDVRQAGALGPAWVTGLLLWVAVTGVHWWWAHIPAGVWVLAR